MVDGLTRVRWIEGIRPDLKRHRFVNDSIERIFRLGGEDILNADCECYVEEKDEENDNLKIRPLYERFEIFSKYHNLTVGHFVTQLNSATL